MDFRDLEMEIQRLIGYDSIVTSGITSKGAHLDFNSGRRFLRIWIPRAGVDPKKIAEMVKDCMTDPHEAAWKEIEYPAS